jgi:ribosomal protein L13E
VEEAKSMVSVEAEVYAKQGKQRRGKGFSRRELKEAGSNVKEAVRNDVPVDIRRRTVYSKNVEAVKRYLETRKTERKLETKRKSKV